MILRKIEREQIVSLHLSTVWFSTGIELFSLGDFTNIISLTLLNFQHMRSIHIYEQYFPKLIRFSLWYDNEVNFDRLNNILQQVRKPIKRLEIHCGGVLCNHHRTDSSNTGYSQKLKVEYFLLDLGHLLLPSMIECIQSYKSCFLMTTINLIKTMPSVRHVHLIANKHNLDELLDANELWKSLGDVCHQLRKITVEVLGTMLENEQLSQS
jgi:hypothetical protein